MYTSLRFLHLRTDEDRVVFSTLRTLLTDVHCFSLTGSCMNSPRSRSFPVEFTVSFFSRSSLTPLPPYSARPRLFFTSARYKGTFQRGQTSDTIKHLIKYQAGILKSQKQPFKQLPFIQMRSKCLLCLQHLHYEE